MNSNKHCFKMPLKFTPVFLSAQNSARTSLSNTNTTRSRWMKSKINSPSKFITSQVSLPQHIQEQQQDPNKSIMSMTVSEKFKCDLKHLQELADQSIFSYQDLDKKLFPEKYQSKTQRRNSIKSPTSSSLLSSVSSTSSYFTSISAALTKKKPPVQIVYPVRKQRFKIDKEALKKEAKKFYHKSFLSGNTLNRVSPNIQLSIYNEQMIILLESVQYYHNKFLSDKSFLKAFCNMNHKLQVKANKLIEQLCVIIVEILRIILCDIYDNIEQIIYSKIPFLNKYSNEDYTNELDVYKSNIMIFNDVINYLELCMEVLKIMVKKVNFITLSIDNSNMLPIYLDRARFKISNLIAMAECYIKKTNADISILKTFEEGIELIPKEPRPPHVVKFISDCTKVMKCKDPILAKMRRIQSVLTLEPKERNIKPMLPKWKMNNSKSQENIKKDNINSVLNSSLLTKIIKYADEPIRQKIISHRVIERYKRMEIEKNLLIENARKEI